MASRTSSAKKRRLGRGLGSLIPTTPVPVEPKPQAVAPASASQVSIDPQPTTPPASVSDSSGGLRSVPLNLIDPNPAQPRRDFDGQSLEALAESIRQAGVMQPIVVRPTSDSGRFQIVAGERRWRAAGLIPLEVIPAVVREIDDATAAEWALIENLQREDLNPIERAEAFSQLIEKHGLTHQELAERIGIDRSTVTNTLRLNDLDSDTSEDVRRGTISTGHAKVLLGIANIAQRRRIAEAATRQGWSVRELERRISAHQHQSAGTERAIAAAPAPVNAHLKDLEEKLGQHLGTKVHIRTGRKKGTGKVIIEFFSLEEFDGLMQRLDFDTA